MPPFRIEMATGVRLEFGPKGIKYFILRDFPFWLPHEAHPKELIAKEKRAANLYLIMGGVANKKGEQEKGVMNAILGLISVKRPQKT